MTVSSLYCNVTIAIEIQESNEKTRSNLWNMVKAVFTFLFWVSAFLIVWLVALKYHEQSRQMLRIETLSNQRIDKRKKRAL